MSSNKQPLISIIVPVYNGEKYLPLLLKSLDNLLFRKYEIIFVDDGSNDNSFRMLKDYCMINNKARLYHISNHGQAFARNYGLGKSAGDYIYFLDADDLFCPSILDALLYGIRLANSDLSICSQHYFRFDRKKTITSKKLIYPKFLILEGRDALQKLLGNTDKWGVVWNKIYKRKILEQNKKYPNIFLKLSVNEDLIFNCWYFSQCRRVAITHQKMYWYRVHKTKIIHVSSFAAKQRFIDAKKVIDFILQAKFLDKKNLILKNKLQKSFEAACAFPSYDYLRQTIRNKNTPPKKDILFVYKVYKKSLKSLFRAQNVPLRLKLAPFVWAWCIPWVKKIIKNR